MLCSTWSYIIKAGENDDIHEKNQNLNKPHQQMFIVWRIENMIEKIMRSVTFFVWHNTHTICCSVLFYMCFIWRCADKNRKSAEQPALTKKIHYCLKMQIKNEMNPWWDKKKEWMNHNECVWKLRKNQKWATKVVPNFCVRVARRLRNESLLYVINIKEKKKKIEQFEPLWNG